MERREVDFFLGLCCFFVGFYGILWCVRCCFSIDDIDRPIYVCSTKPVTIVTIEIKECSERL